MWNWYQARKPFMLVDVGLATGTLGVLWFFGIPIVLLIGSPQKGGKGAVRCLHGAPFVGCAVIILISQTLFYVGIPVAHSVAFLWAAAVMGWVSLAIAGRLHHWRTPEWPLIPVLVCIYAVQALGLFMLGSQVYVGSGWHATSSIGSRPAKAKRSTLLGSTISLAEISSMLG
jgi:hypothetical protein